MAFTTSKSTLSLTNVGDLVGAGGLCGDAGCDGDHDEEEGDEEADAVVALVRLQVERGEARSREERHRNEVRYHVGEDDP